jgi:hypothetical protein
MDPAEVWDLWLSTVEKVLEQASPTFLVGQSARAREFAIGRGGNIVVPAG